MTSAALASFASASRSVASTCSTRFCNDCGILREEDEEGGAEQGATKPSDEEPTKVSTSYKPRAGNCNRESTHGSRRDGYRCDIHAEDRHPLNSQAMGFKPCRGRSDEGVGRDEDWKGRAREAEARAQRNAEEAERLRGIYKAAEDLCLTRDWDMRPPEDEWARALVAAISKVKAVEYGGAIAPSSATVAAGHNDAKGGG